MYSILPRYINKLSLTLFPLHTFNCYLIYYALSLLSIIIDVPNILLITSNLGAYRAIVNIFLILADVRTNICSTEIQALRNTFNAGTKRGY